MKKLFLLPLLIVTMPSQALAQAQLVDNFPNGLERICVYSNLSRRSAENSRRLRTGQTLERVTRVGLAEPCPATYRAPRQVDPASTIPSTARLQSDSLRNGIRTCTYVASTREYQVSISAAQRCPLSPIGIRSIVAPGARTAR